MKVKLLRQNCKHHFSVKKCNNIKAFRSDIKLYIIIVLYGFGYLVYGALSCDCMSNSRLYILDRLMHSNKLYMYVLLVGDYAPQLNVYSTLVPHSAVEFCGPTLSPPS